jgi:positive regulator of sigma E activity
MRRPRATGAYLELFLEALLVAAAEAVFTAIGWLVVRVYRRFKRRKK